MHPEIDSVRRHVDEYVVEPLLVGTDRINNASAQHAYYLMRFKTCDDPSHDISVTVSAAPNDPCCVPKIREQAFDLINEPR